ncbi:MAG: hypothetical protein GXN94_03935 [Aquificae bacterium]|nr:hypothetical protein [Aquificota bacterium]
MESKMLTPKDIFYMVLPVVAGLVLFVIGINYGKRLVPMPAVEEDFSFLEEMEKGIFTVKHPEVKFISRELFEIILEIRPYQEKVHLPDRDGRERQTVKQEQPPQYKVSFIYIGKGRYAIINGKLYKEGDILPSDEKIVKITKNGVLIKGKWGDRWLKFSGF